METNEVMTEQAAQADVADVQNEQLTETQDASESLDSIFEEEKQAEPQQEQPKESSGGTEEPGWFQKRWNKEKGKLADQIRAEVRSEYEAQFAPMRERLIEMDAKDLVAKGVVKDIETAKELVRYRQGLSAKAEQPKPAAQPRNEKGQFSSASSPKEDPAINARIDMLSHQADSIKARRGIDVIAEFNSNPEIKQKVINGEMDFYDVAEQMSSGKPQSRGKPPAPMRSPNGASGAEKSSIASMSKEQFARMEQRIREGARFEVK